MSRTEEGHEREQRIAIPPYGTLWMLLAVWGVAYFGALISILSEWADAGAYSHGALVLAMAAYVVWERRDLVQYPRDSLTPIWPLFLFGASGFWWIGQIAHVRAAEQLGAILTLYFAAISLFGFSRLRPVGFAALSLTTVIPVWDFLNQPLRSLSADVTSWALGILSVPVLREGFTLSLPGGVFVIDPGCSGLGFLLCAIVLCAFYGHLNALSWPRTVGYGLVGVLFAMLSNWLRILVIVIVGNETNMSHPLIEDHIFFGWILFSVLLLPLLAIGRFFVPFNNVPTHNSGASERLVNSTMSTRSWSTTLIVFVFVCAGPVFWAIMDQSGSFETPYSFPSEADGFVKQSGLLARWEYRFPGALATQRVDYSTDQTEVYALAVTYHEQSQDRELVNGLNELYDRERWSQLSSEGTFSYRLVRLRDRPGNQRVILFWYEVAGHRTGSGLYAKLLEVFGYLSGVRGGVLVALSVEGRSLTKETELALFELREALMRAE